MHQMRIKRIFIGGVVAVLGGSIATYFVVPAIARSVVLKKIEADPNNSVKDVSISWSGPQRIAGLHVESKSGIADIDVVIENSLFSMLTRNTPMKVGVRGNAVLVIQEQPALHPAPQPSRGNSTPTSPKKKNTSFPQLELEVLLDSVTVESDESMLFSEVKGTLDVAPGRHFNATLSAKTDMDGSVNATCNAPDLIEGSGVINWNSGGTLTFDITNAAIPTINGAGGWSITEMHGEVSSPNLTESLSVAINGTLSEYNIPRGNVNIKTQLAMPMRQGVFVFDDRNLVGSIDLENVPTSILAPLVGVAHVDTERDLGPTMNVRIERIEEGPPLTMVFDSRDLHVSATVDQDNGLISDVEITANVHSEFLESLTEGQIVGDASIIIRLDQLVPAGFSSNDNPECIGHLALEGELQHVPSRATIQSIDAAISADVGNRSFETLGGITIDNRRSKFHVQLHNENKNKLDGLDDLFKIIVREFPRGGGAIELQNLPASLVQQYLPSDSIVASRDIGETMNINVAMGQSRADVQITSEKLQGSCKVLLEGDEISGFSDVVLSGTIEKELAQYLTGVQFGSASTITAQLKHFDLDWNSIFEVTFTIGNQKTLVQGSTTRSVSGSLNLQLAATGIDTRLIDEMFNSGGVLSDSFGSPATLELLATDILNNPTLIAGGSTENATFEASIGITEGNVFSIKETTSRADVRLTTSLTKHVLKGLGPILSDIRSVDRPISITISNASASLEGDLSKLNADIRIDIGAVELDSASITMQLLPSFKSSHVITVPAFFEPIQIEIRNGVVKYKEFRLTIDNKYAIPHSGTINLITRKLDLKSTVPLTGLGHSIKELRNLETDIDVPLRTTGTIEDHVTTVDPSFDLNKVLESVAIELIGDAIEDALGAGKDDSVDPIKLIEDLLGGG
jgi:hypothetical protein